MLPEKMEKEFNQQIREETYSAYLYLSMAAWFASRNLMGFAAWMKVQAQEEMGHAMKFFNHVVERGGTVKLEGLAQPPATFEKPVEAFKQALKHEQHITSRINHMVGVARDAKDWASDNFLQWYVSEQVEEEATADGIVHQLELVGDGNGLFMLDRELGTRTFAYPGSAIAPGGQAGA